MRLFSRTVLFGFWFAVAAAGMAGCSRKEKEQPKATEATPPAAKPAAAAGSAAATMDCASCKLRSECQFVPKCDSLTTAATEGPAKGTPRKQLCEEVAQCLEQNNCSKGVTLDCYCGQVSDGECDSGKGNGPCRTAIERGVETTAASEVMRRFQNHTLGGGLAIARANCLQLHCPMCTPK